MLLTYAYESDRGSVECRVETDSQNRYIAVVILVTPIDAGSEVVRNTLPGSDDNRPDALTRARAWAERTYPPRGANEARFSVHDPE